MNRLNTFIVIFCIAFGVSIVSESGYEFSPAGRFYLTGKAIAGFSILLVVAGVFYLCYLVYMLFVRAIRKIITLFAGVLGRFFVQGNKMKKKPTFVDDVGELHIEMESLDVGNESGDDTESESEDSDSDSEDCSEEDMMMDDLLVHVGQEDFESNDEESDIESDEESESESESDEKPEVIEYDSGSDTDVEDEPQVVGLEMNFLSLRKRMQLDLEVDFKEMKNHQKEKDRETVQKLKEIVNMSKRMRLNREYVKGKKTVKKLKDVLEVIKKKREARMELPRKLAEQEKEESGVVSHMGREEDSGETSESEEDSDSDEELGNERYSDSEDCSDSEGDMMMDDLLVHVDQEDFESNDEESDIESDDESESESESDEEPEVIEYDSGSDTDVEDEPQVVGLEMNFLSLRKRMQLDLEVDFKEMKNHQKEKDRETVQKLKEIVNVSKRMRLDRDYVKGKKTVFKKLKEDGKDETEEEDSDSEEEPEVIGYVSEIDDEIERVAGVVFEEDKEELTQLTKMIDEVFSGVEVDVWNGSVLIEMEDNPLNRSSILEEGEIDEELSFLDDQ